MLFLYEQLDTLREFGSYTEIPPYIQENVNQRFELRPYQIGAFENFITYFENEKMCRNAANRRKRCSTWQLVLARR